MSDQQNFMTARAPKPSGERQPQPNPRFVANRSQDGLGVTLYCLNTYLEGTQPTFQIADPPADPITITDLATGVVTTPPPGEQFQAGQVATYCTLPGQLARRLQISVPRILVTITETGQTVTIEPDFILLQPWRTIP